jgi:transcriptional regulator of acetoin/glycerol metabolism
MHSAPPGLSDRDLTGYHDDAALVSPPDRDAEQIITASHSRSAEFGLDRADRTVIDPVSRSDMTTMLEKSRSLRLHAMPVMESLYENIINTHSMVLLTDNSGTILHALGDDDFLQRAQRVALAPGVCWAEQNKGTNAIGTAIVENAPTVVHADQHYLRANHFLTCSASPITDPNGNVVGVLDVTGDFRSYHKHTMALVRMSAQIIENHVFNDAYPDAIRVHFHTRPEFIGTLMEGIVAFDAGGRFLAASRGASFLIGLSRSALHAHTFSSLFGMPISALSDHYRTTNNNPVTARLLNGLIVHLKADMRSATRWVVPGGVAQGMTQPGERDAGRPRNNAQGGASSSQGQAEHANARSARLSSLRYLNTGDPQMNTVIQKVQRVIDRDIPIMVIGETGTGKELLAQAIHNDSPRANMPFVAVNCASLPDTLIESELFGYEDGAFTGARKRGNHGKILAANGGTLLLDEVGDMPPNLQARLLRVLQERVVTPLGSTKSIPVNVMVICATNRNLRDMVVSGTFREDLYYRLNGLVLKLPALRDRTDLDVIVAKILLNERHDGPPFTVSDEVMALFKSYRWPGNFRQLTNVIRTMLVMSDDDHVIRPEHLPDDFLEDVEFDRQGMHQAAAKPVAGVTVPFAVAETAAASAEFPAGATPGVQTPDAAPREPAWAVEGKSLDEVEVAMIKRALEEHRGNVSAAARALGISRNTIYRKLPSLSQTQAQQRTAQINGEPLNAA